MARTLQDGISLIKQGGIDEARAIFAELLEAEPKDGLAHLWMANCHVLDGDVKKARASFRQAVEHGDDKTREEARQQLNSIWYNRLLNRLVLDPPLRYLLLAAAVAYGAGFLLTYLGFEQKISLWFAQVSVYGLLPLFFIWVFFIIAYFMGHLAFDTRLKGRSVRIARTVIAIAGILVIPTNLLLSHGPWVVILALILDVFFVSLFLSQVFNWLGRKLTGDTNPIILTLLHQFEDNTNLTEAPIPIERDKHHN